MFKYRNLLKSYRNRSALSQKDIAKLFNEPNCTSISRYENGHRLPDVSTMLKYQYLFDSPAEEIFKDTIGQIKVRLVKRLKLLEKKLDAEDPETQVRKKFVSESIKRLSED